MPCDPSFSPSGADYTLMLATSQILSKSIHDVGDEAREILQSWYDRLTFPPTKLLERYLRGDLGVVLQCVADNRLCGCGDRGTIAFSLFIQHQLGNNDVVLGCSARYGEHDVRLGNENGELSMLVDDVQLVNYPNGIVFGVGHGSLGAGLVWLQIVNKFSDFRFGNSLYFSFVKGDCVFVGWPSLKDGKFKTLTGGPSPLNLIREFPYEMVKDRTKMMHNFSSENAKAGRHDPIAVIVNRILPKLVVWAGDNWILPLLNEDINLGLEIKDVLVGPF
jgi:hypothetical protein